MICDHFQLAAVPFPFMERPASKRRPALVVSNRNFNSENDHTVVAMVTTAKVEHWASDYIILKPAEAGLPKDCFVRWKIFTLPNMLISKVIGDMADEDREALMIQARKIFIRA